MAGQHCCPWPRSRDRKAPVHARQAGQDRAVADRVAVELEDGITAAFGGKFQNVGRLARKPHLGVGAKEAGVAHDRQDARPVSGGGLGFGQLEQLLRVELTRHVNEAAAFLADEVREHVGPLGTECFQVGIDQQERIVVSQLGGVVGQPADRSVAGLAKAGIGMLQPGGKLDPLIAHQRVAQELHLGRRRARDQEHANLLAHDFHRGRCHVVFLGQLGAGIFDLGPEFILADDFGRDPERGPLEDSIFAQDHAFYCRRPPNRRH